MNVGGGGGGGGGGVAWLQLEGNQKVTKTCKVTQVNTHGISEDPIISRRK
jgi:hypothetical protein